MPSCLIIVENLPVPLDRRVWQEALALTEAGWQVSVICPRTFLYPEEEEVIDEHIEDIKRVGFDIRKFGDRTYVVEAVPALLREGAKQAMLAEIVDEIIELRSGSEDIKHVIAASVACKAALKAGDKLNEEEVNSIIKRLFETRMPFACPHGRPTMIRLSWDEIERRFLRR